MFADDVGLLPDHMFTRMLRHVLRAPERFGGELAGDLFPEACLVEQLDHLSSPKKHVR